MTNTKTNRIRSFRWSWLTAGATALALCLLAGGCASPQQKEARFLESGKKMMGKKDYPRAIIQFQNAAKAMPKDGEAYYQLALAYFANNQVKVGAAILQKAAKLGDQGARLKMAELIATSSNSSDVEAAQHTIQGLMESGPVNAEELDALAFTELKLGHKEEAEKHLKEAFEKFPSDLRSAANLARVKLARNDLAGAEEVLKKAAEQKPPVANAAIALGSFYVRIGKNVEAEQQFRRAVQIDPKSGLALMSLAAVQFRAGNKDQAEQTYAQVSALPEKEYKPLHALFLANTGKYEQAIPEFEKLSRQSPADRTLRTYLVKAYVSARRPAEAGKVLDSALQKNPKDVEALTQRGTLSLMTGKTDSAAKDLTQALTYRTDSPQLHYLMAKVYEVRGDSLKQKQELAEALRLQPAFLPARAQLSRALIAAGSAQDALNLIDDPAAKSQRNSLAWIVADNWALLALKRNDEARKQIDQALAVVKAPELLQQDALLKMQLKDYAGARASLNQALNQLPENLGLMRLIVASYAAEKQPAAALDTMRAYARQHPKSAPVQQFLAELLLANGQRDEARSALQAAKAADPKFVRADLVLAQLDSSEGHADLAAKQLTAVLAQNPNNPAALLQLATVQEQAGQRTEAIDNYRKVLETQPSNVMALNNLAFALAEYDKKPDEALPYAQKAVQLAPQAAAVEDTLGWVLYRKGLYSMAIPHLEKATKTDPTARRDCHLAMAYFNLGNSQKGTQYLEDAVRKDPNVPEIKMAQQVLDQMHGAH